MTIRRLTSWLFMLVVGVVMLALTPRVRAQASLQTVLVTMPDGVELATDVWTQALASDARPVLLRRTPYGRAVTAQQANNVVGSGYVLVSQDVRGRGGSAGAFLPFFDDKVDGKATIDWIAQQAWSNGKVATYGASAEGIVQYMAMASAPDALRCTHVSVATHDLYEGMFPGGLWRTELGTTWLTNLGAAQVIDTWKSHEVRDGYWDAAALSFEEMAEIDHPVFLVGGMFDIFAPSQVRALNELRAHVAPSARNDVFLVMGPWTHGGTTQRRQGDLLYPDTAPHNDNVPDLLNYLNWCLHDAPRPDFPPLRFFITELTDEVSTVNDYNTPLIEALGEWRSAEGWPPAGVHTVTMFLHQDDVLHGEQPDAAGTPIELAVDPNDPTPSLGGANLTTAAGPFDQAALDLRPEVYVTQTAALTEPVEVIGNLRATLWVASATTDIDVVVRVEDLTPQGRAVAFADGALRGRFARGFGAVRALSPGTPVPFEIEVGPLALRLPEGHALRIALSSVSSPRYEPNPNVADPLAGAPTPKPTTLTLYRDPDHPSRVEIPVASGRLPGTVDPPDAGTAPSDAGATPNESNDAATGSSPDASSDTGATPFDAAPAESARSKNSNGCSCRTLQGSSKLPAPAWFVLGLLVLAIRRRRCHRS